MRVIVLLLVLLSAVADARVNAVWASSARRNITELKQLLDSDATVDVDQFSKQGLAGLHYACMHGDQDIAKLLLEHKANPNIKSSQSQSTPLLLAVSRGHPDVVPLLIAAGSDVNTANKVGATPLLKAVEHGLDSAVTALLKAKADVKAQTSEGETALHVAAEMDKAEIAALLIGHGAEVDATTNTISVLAGYGGGDRGANTPLHEAASEGNHQVVELLLKHGANPNTVDAEQENALTKAVKSGSVASVMLLKGKSDPQPAELQQVWHPAIHHGRLNQIKALIALESVSRCDWVKENSTGLHIASREGRKSTFAHVLNDTMKQGCSLDLQDGRGRTALMLAASEGHAVVVDKLLKAGADASIQDNDPRVPHTALHWACIRGHSRAMEKLYDSKKLPEQTQLELMSLAVSHGHTTVVAIFQAAGLESVQVVEAHNMSVLEVAVQWNQAGVVAQLLEQSGNLITKHHVEALHLAAALGSPGVVNKLVVAGVSVDARDEKMWTPLMKAASRGSVKAAQSLVDLGAAISAVDSNGANASMIAMRHEQKSAGLLQLIQPDGWTVVEEDTSVDLKDNTPTLQITELTNANFDEHVITSPGGIFMVLFTMGGSGDSESAEALKKFEQAAAEAHGLAKFGIVDAGGLSNGPLRRRWDIERFPSILVFRPDQRGEKGTTEGPRLFEGDLTSEAIFDSVMELNYEAQRAIRLEEAQAKENEKIDVELTHPKKAGSIADQLGYSSDEPVEGRVDDEL